MIDPINAAPLIRQSTPGQNASGMSNGTADQDPEIGYPSGVKNTNR